MEDSKKESKAKNFIKRYCNNKLAVIGFFTLVLITLIVIIAPPFLPFSEAEIDPLAFNMPPMRETSVGRRRCRQRCIKPITLRWPGVFGSWNFFHGGQRDRGNSSGYAGSILSWGI